jgi:hypothetical protein
MNRVRIPPAAERDPDAVEMLGVWIAEQGLHCSLRIGSYRERGIVEEQAWGTILADAARHIARALAADSALEEGVVLDSLRSHMLAELDDPSSPIRGGFVTEP